MKKFNSETEMMLYGKTRDWCVYDDDFEIVMCKDEKIILCQDNRAYEEFVWSNCYEIFEYLKSKFGFVTDYCNYDNADLFRDKIIEYFENKYKVRFVNVCEEY